MKKLLCIFTAVLMLFFTSCSNTADNSAPKEPSNTAANEREDKKIALYFADSQGLKLKKEMRKMADEYSSPEEAVVSELIKGSNEKERVSVMPEGTRLIGISTEDGLCTVNLSSEFIDNSNGGSAFDTLSVYSVVNSLCALDNVDKVQFLIDGKTVEVYGNFIFDEPFEADDNLE